MEPGVGGGVAVLGARRGVRGRRGAGEAVREPEAGGGAAAASPAAARGSAAPVVVVGSKARRASGCA